MTALTRKADYTAKWMRAVNASSGDFALNDFKKLLVGVTRI